MLFDEDEDICAKVAFLFVSDLVLIYVGPHLVWMVLKVKILSRLS